MRIDSTYKNNPDYYDVIIIGAGPAGMSAAIYAQRSALKTAIIEKDSPGGKIVKTAFVENYPGFKKITGPDLAYGMYDQINSLGVKYIYGDVIEIKKVQGYFHVFTKDNITKFSKTVIIATGMVEKKIGVPGEIEFYGKGVSYCAICDGPLYKDKFVAVIGGGNSALEESIFLSDIVKEVHLIHRRNEFRGEESLVDKIRKIDNIKIHLNNIPISFNSTNNKITSITIENNETKLKDTIAVDAIFPFLGFLPVSKFVEKLNITDAEGYIIVDNDMKTSVKGLFAIGDILKKDFRQISTSVSDGTIAALNCKKYIEKDILE